MSALFSAAAGAAAIVIPVVLLRGAIASAGRGRVGVLLQAALAGISAAGCLVAAAGEPRSALLGALVVTLSWSLWRVVARARTRTPDIVVERPLLDASLSPTLLAELTGLEAQMRANALKSPAPAGPSARPR